MWHTGKCLNECHLFGMVVDMTILLRLGSIITKNTWKAFSAEKVVPPFPSRALPQIVLQSATLRWSAKQPCMTN